MKKRILLAICLFCLFAGVAAAASADGVMKKWTRSERYRDSWGEDLTVHVTYYSAEYIEALVQSEADKNLWTADETESFRYEFLKSLRLEDTIPVNIAFENYGSPMHMAPFDKQVNLWIDDKEYGPVDYDKRFNFKLSGKQEGLVHFARYDAETGRDLLEGVKSIKLVLEGSVSPITMGKKIRFVWDVAKDDPGKLFSGAATARLEMERLLKRLERLSAKEKELQLELDKVRQERLEIEARVEELQKQ